MSAHYYAQHLVQLIQLVLRRKEIMIGLDFIHNLNETGGFYNLLQSDFDFKQFKVYDYALFFKATFGDIIRIIWIWSTLQ